MAPVWTDVRKFTKDDRKNRDLVLKMLKYEDSVFTGPEGQSLFELVGRQHFNANNAISRVTLSRFGFDTSDESLEEYRKIFSTYYRGPDDFDEEIIESVVYFRSNRLIRYKSPDIPIGSTIPDCKLFRTDGTETSLYSKLDEKPFEYAVIAGFSLS